MLKMGLPCRAGKKGDEGAGMGTFQVCLLMNMLK